MNYRKSLKVKQLHNKARQSDLISRRTFCNEMQKLRQLIKPLRLALVVIECEVMVEPKNKEYISLSITNHWIKPFIPEH